MQMIADLLHVIFAITPTLTKERGAVMLILGVKEQRSAGEPYTIV